MKYNKLTAIISSILLTVGSLFSQSPTGAVCISENGDIPHESAILQVSSQSKGVLFPRMSFDAAVNINNKKDGLIVFITDSAKLGYWYWNAGEAKWMQIRDEDSGGQDIQAPYGGIILYSGEVSSQLFTSGGCGKTGTKMQGWHICNGNDGTPNLIGMFVMGALSSTSPSNRTGGADSVKMTINQMPAHTHEVQTVSGTIESHRHTISESPHTHSVEVTWKRKLTHRHYYIRAREKHSEGAHFLPAAYDAGPEGNLQMTEAVGTITFSTTELNNEIEIEDAGEGKPIDNRPPFYVLLYLMRVNPEGCP